MIVSFSLVSRVTDGLHQSGVVSPRRSACAYSCAAGLYHRHTCGCARSSPACPARALSCSRRSARDGGAEPRPGLGRSSSRRCAVGAGGARSAPRSALRCQPRRRADYGCDRRRLAQSPGFTAAEMRALQGSPDGTSFTAVSAARGTFSRVFTTVIVGQKQSWYICCAWRLPGRDAAPSVPCVTLFSRPKALGSVSLRCPTACPGPSQRAAALPNGGTREAASGSAFAQRAQSGQGCSPQPAARPRLKGTGSVRGVSHDRIVRPVPAAPACPSFSSRPDPASLQTFGLSRVTERVIYRVRGGTVAALF